MGIPLAILHVEDIEDDHLLVLRTLKQGGYDAKATRCETREEMRAALAAQPYDIILCDHKLPHFDSFGALQVLKASGLDLPFIIVSGSIPGEVAVEAMRLGAQDFIFKNNLTHLVPAVQRELHEAEGRRAQRQAEQALQESDEELQALIRSSPIGITVLDPDGIVKLWNPANERMFGWTATEALGKFLPYVPQEKRGEFKALREAVLAGKTITSVEVDRRRRDGLPIYLSVSAAPLRDSHGNITSLFDMTLDITERKLSEGKIMRQLQHLTALSTIERVIASNFDLGIILAQILTHVTTELGVDAADIQILDDSSQILELTAQRGFRTRATHGAQMHQAGGYVGRLVLERRLVQNPAPGAEPDKAFFTTYYAGEDFACYFGVPLIVKGKVKGVLEILHRAAIQPDDEWFDFLDALAGQTAIALENVSLFTSLQRSNFELMMAYDATIEGWSHALDLRDKETEGHTQRVTAKTLELARNFGLTESELVQVRWGSLLHDIGKMGVPDAVLHKPGPLTDEEWVDMKKHPTFAYEMLSPIRYLRYALDIPYCHHEKWDGSGYPQGLSGTQIPLVARIFAVADVWDALTSDRPYRPAWSEEKAHAHILACAGTHFDPRVVANFFDTANQTEASFQPPKSKAKPVETSKEDTIKDSELQYRRLFEAAQDGILILDAGTGAITDVNPFLIDMLGFTREEFMEKKLWEMDAFRDVHASKEAFLVLQREEYIRYKDLPLKAKDGHMVAVEFVSNVYQAGERKVIQCNIRDITERKNAQNALIQREALFREQSVRDHLTGLFNRRYMEETLDRELLRATRNNSPIGIIMLDVDDFKRFNDTYGHSAGDAILHELGGLLLGHVRGEDIPCRYGGDEFIIVLPGATVDITRERAELLCMHAAHFEVEFEGRILGSITLSLGIAVSPANGSTSAEVLKVADSALYRAKSEGPGRVATAL